jgi:hypothetical protein
LIELSCAIASTTEEPDAPNADQSTARPGLCRERRVTGVTTARQDTHPTSGLTQLLEPQDSIQFLASMRTDILTVMRRKRPNCGIVENTARLPGSYGLQERIVSESFD